MNFLIIFSSGMVILWDRKCVESNSFNNNHGINHNLLDRWLRTSGFRLLLALRLRVMCVNCASRISMYCTDYSSLIMENAFWFLTLSNHLDRNNKTFLKSNVSFIGFGGLWILNIIAYQPHDKTVQVLIWNYVK